MRVTVRTMGVEEELMLVDPDTGVATGVADRAMRLHVERTPEPTAHQLAEPGEEVEQELFLQQIETATKPCVTVHELERELKRCRRAVGEAAREAGSAAVAVSTPILIDTDATVTPKDRYRRIRDEYGETSRQAVVCGMHMHVGVADDEEGVGVLDRIRPWLPTLLAISANSPYWRGRDTGYASWRSQIWGSWPCAGPAEPFGDLTTYQRVSEAVIESGAALDRGMLYFDARLAEKYSTVEIRVADVCTAITDTQLVACLARAIVETAAQQWAAGRPPAEVRVDILRAALWRAAKTGVGGDLVHPVRGGLAPARNVFQALVEATRPALDEAGDTDFVAEAFDRLVARGSGASAQRSVGEAHGNLAAVVHDLRERTEASWLEP